MTRGGRAWGALALALRVLLGGAFVFSAVTKLSDPSDFARAILKFKVVTEAEHLHVVKVAAYAIPWTELLCGVCLLLGLWTRAAAALLGVALAGFIVLIAGVLQRGEVVECGCFGRLRLLCPGAQLTECNLWQNGVLLGMGVILVAGGGGRWSVDGACRRRVKVRPADLRGPDAGG